MITMFEEAYKKQPHHEELGVQTFFAIVRTGNWKAAQQVCPCSDDCSVSYRRYAARHENAQAVPRRPLHLLECHQCCSSGKLITQIRRIYPDNTFEKARDPSTPASMRPILFKLSHRLLSSAIAPSYLSADRFYLHLSILKELELWDDAHQLLTTEPAKMICETSLIVDEIRREVWKRKGLWDEEKQMAQRRITEKG